MASVGDEDRDLFEYEEEDDDSEFDSEDDDGRDEAEAVPPPTAPAAAGQDPNPSLSSAVPSSDGTPNPNPNPNFPANGAIQTLAISSSAAPEDLFTTPSPDRKRQRTASEESRRIFQKLWTDEDEIAILQGFLEFTSQRGTTHADYQYDTGPFFDQIRTRLQLDFNKNQLVEKLRRLKRKYRNAVSRIASGKEAVFKSPHDRATFEISRKIWSSSFKRARKRRADRPPNAQSAHLYIDAAHNGAPDSDRSIRKRSAEEAGVVAAVPVEVTVQDSVALPLPAAHMPSTLAPITSTIEETVRSCLSPLFKEMLHCVIGGAGGPGGIAGGGLALNPPQLNLPGSESVVDERWKKQQILELEVFLKRTELVQEQIKSALEELRSMGS